MNPKLIRNNLVPFYRAMHYSAERGIVTVIQSVCYVRDLWVNVVVVVL